jgi:DNA-binding response OmpR family regulator
VAAILLAEDEPRILSFVRKGLTANGFSVTVAVDGHTAYRYAASGEFDLMVLDIDLPGVDGRTVLRRLRAERRSLPVVVLTERSGADTASAVPGQADADDYLVKPFRFEELLTRVRQRLLPARAARVAELSYGGLRLDLRNRRAHVGDYSVNLSAREFALVETFLRHPGQVLSREWLRGQVWGEGFGAGSNVVDVYITYLRRKLGARRFAAVRGMGYRLEAVP